MPYTKYDQEHVVRLTETHPYASLKRNSHHKDVDLDWLHENIENDWSLDVTTTLDEYVWVDVFHYSFADIADAALFRLRF